MTPEEWQKVRPILESALELDSAKRASYLDRECTDPSLRRELESLIAAHDREGTNALDVGAVPSFSQSVFKCALNACEGNKTRRLRDPFPAWIRRHG
jgi:hypothetical protein